MKTYTLLYQQIEEFSIKVKASDLHEAIQFVSEGGMHMDREEALQEYPAVEGFSDHKKSGTQGVLRQVWNWKEGA